MAAVLFLTVVFVLAVISGWQLHRLDEQRHMTAGTDPELSPRVRVSQLDAAKPALEEWERVWKEETGETWGTVYTLDPVVYQRYQDRYEGTMYVDDGHGGTVTMHTLGGRYGPPVVFGEDPFQPERTKGRFTIADTKLNANQYFGAGDGLDMSIPLHKGGND